MAWRLTLPTLRSRAPNDAIGIMDKFHMSPTCPPSTSVVVRGGIVWGVGYGDAAIFQTQTFDVADYDATHREPIFENAYWYSFYWLSRYGDRLYVGGGTTNWLIEYETAVEAEQAALNVDCVQLHNFPPWDYGIPIGCCILRNNGDTNFTNQFQPIDATNRGRSYILRTSANLALRNIA